MGTGVMTDAPRLADCLAPLFEYPGASYRATVAECRAAIEQMLPSAAADLERFANATERISIEALQELYVATFDLNPRCTLDLGWHLHGEAYERGALLAMLREDMQHAGVSEGGELPDHLTSLLKLLARVTAARRVELAPLLEPALSVLQTSLDACHSPYADLMKIAVATTRAGG